MSYPTFEDIDNTVLRTWNRCATASNILDDKGPVESQAYLKKFEEKDRKKMLLMFRYIQVKGYEETKAEVFRTIGKMEA